MAHPGAWSNAMTTARWDKREEVYFGAVRERQKLREELHQTSVTAMQREAALTHARGELEMLRGVVENLSTEAKKAEEWRRAERAEEDLRAEYERTSAEFERHRAEAERERAEAERERAEMASRSDLASDLASERRRRMQLARREEEALSKLEARFSTAIATPATAYLGTHTAAPRAAARVPLMDDEHSEARDSSPSSDRVVAVGATMEVDAVEILRECAASAEAARTAGAREAHAEAEAAALRLDLAMRAAESRAVQHCLLEDLAASEGVASELAAEVSAARSSRHASALSTLATHAKAKRVHRVSLAAEAVAASACLSADVTIVSVASELQLAEEEARAAAVGREAAEARARVLESEAASTAADLRLERSARAVERGEEARRLEEVSAVAMAEARAAAREIERKEAAVRTSSEIEHAAVGAVVDVLRAELASVQEARADESRELQSACDAQRERAENAERRLRALEADAATQQRTLSAEAHSLRTSLGEATRERGVASAELGSGLADAERVVTHLTAALAQSESRRHGLAFLNLAHAARARIAASRAAQHAAGLTARLGAEEMRAAEYAAARDVAVEALWHELHSEEVEHAEAAEVAARKGQLAQAAIAAAESRAHADRLRWSEEREGLVTTHAMELEQMKTAARSALTDSRGAAQSQLEEMAQVAEESAARAAQLSRESLALEREKGERALSSVVSGAQQGQREARVAHTTLVGAVLVADDDAAHARAALGLSRRAAYLAEIAHATAIASEKAERATGLAALQKSMAETEQELSMVRARCDYEEVAVVAAAERVTAAEARARAATARAERSAVDSRGVHDAELVAMRDAVATELEAAESATSRAEDACRIERTAKLVGEARAEKLSAELAEAHMALRTAHAASELMEAEREKACMQMERVVSAAEAETQRLAAAAAAAEELSTFETEGLRAEVASLREALEETQAKAAEAEAAADGAMLARVTAIRDVSLGVQEAEARAASAQDKADAAATATAAAETRAVWAEGLATEAELRAADAEAHAAAADAARADAAASARAARAALGWLRIGSAVLNKLRASDSSASLSGLRTTLQAKAGITSREHIMSLACLRTEAAVLAAELAGSDVERADVARAAQTATARASDTADERVLAAEEAARSHADEADELRRALGVSQRSLGVAGDAAEQAAEATEAVIASAAAREDELILRCREAEAQTVRIVAEVEERSWPLLAALGKLCDGGSKGGAVCGITRGASDGGSRSLDSVDRAVDTLVREHAAHAEAAVGRVEQRATARLEAAVRSHAAECSVLGALLRGEVADSEQSVASTLAALREASVAAAATEDAGRVSVGLLGEELIVLERGLMSARDEAAKGAKELREEGRRLKAESARASSAAEAAARAETQAAASSRALQDELASAHAATIAAEANTAAAQAETVEARAETAEARAALMRDGHEESTRAEAAEAQQRALASRVAELEEAIEESASGEMERVKKRTAKLKAKLVAERQRADAAEERVSTALATAREVGDTAEELRGELHTANERLGDERRRSTGLETAASAVSTASAEATTKLHEELREARAHAARVEGELANERRMRDEAEKAAEAAEEAVAVVVSKAGSTDAERKQQLLSAQAEMAHWQRAAQEGWHAAASESKRRHESRINSLAELEKASQRLLPSESPQLMVLGPRDGNAAFTPDGAAGMHARARKSVGSTPPSTGPHSIPTPHSMPSVDNAHAIGRRQASVMVAVPHGVGATPLSFAPNLHGPPPTPLSAATVPHGVGATPLSAVTPSILAAPLSAHAVGLPSSGCRATPHAAGRDAIHPSARPDGRRQRSPTESPVPYHVTGRSSVTPTADLAYATSQIAIWAATPKADGDETATSGGGPSAGTSGARRPATTPAAGESA